MPRLTPWFPPEVKPVRVGLYPRDWKDVFPDGISIRDSCDYWDGERWINSASGKPLPTPRRWRGLAKQPKEQA